MDISQIPSLLSTLHAPLSIALTSPYDYAFPGGVTEHVRALARHLHQRGHRVTVIAPTSQPNAGEEGFVPLHAAIHALPMSGAIARVATSPLIWREMHSLLRQPYDIVHIHEPTVPPLSLAVLHHARVPVVGTFHHYHLHHPYHELTHSLTRRFVGKLAARIAVSEAAEATASPYFAGAYDRIPNGVEIDTYRTAVPFAPRTHKRDLNILFVGRLEPRKGLYHLLQAFAIVKAQMPHAKLWVVGAYSAAEKRPYVRWIRHHGVHGVRFVGHVSDEDKARWYKSADLVCAPSTGHESFGIVLLEAMAAGVPIIASDIPGYREVIQHNATGFLVPAADSTALSNAILALARDLPYRTALAANATRYVSRYDWDTVTDAVEQLYYRVLEHTTLLASAPLVVNA